MDEFVKVSPAQKKIIEILSSLKPHEFLKVSADKDGRPDTFIITRTSKILISGDSMAFLKVSKEDIGEKY